MASLRQAVVWTSSWRSHLGGLAGAPQHSRGARDGAPNIALEVCPEGVAASKGGTFRVKTHRRLLRAGSTYVTWRLERCDPGAQRARSRGYLAPGLSGVRALHRRTAASVGCRRHWQVHCTVFRTSVVMATEASISSTHSPYLCDPSVVPKLL